MIGVPFFGVVLWLFGLLALYLVIRLAVRHAIRDADERRSRGGR